MQIIEKDGHKTCYLDDSSIWYKTPVQSQTFLDFKNSDEYKDYVVKPEFNLFENNLEKVKEYFTETEYNVIDLGCGDGVSVLCAVNVIKGESRITYIPIDASKHMLENATYNAEKQGFLVMPTSPVFFENIDIVRNYIDNSSYKKSKFFLLGSTFLNYSPDMILSTISNVMKEGDVLCVGLTLSDPETHPVRTESEFKSEAEFFLLVLGNLDINKDNVRFYERVYDGKGESCYEFEKKTQVKINGEVIDFNPGDVLVVAYAHLYTLESIKTLVKEYFTQADFYTNESKENCLFVVVK